MRGSACPLRVLVVDDNADTVSSLAFLIRTWGHDVRVAHDGQAALDAALDFRPDVLLLDIGLPKLDGFAVTQQLRARADFAQTFIVATSGYGREKDRRKAAEVGFDLYLVKPYNPWRLEEVLAARRLAEALSA